MFVGGGMASPKTVKKHTKKHRRHHHHHSHHHTFHPPDLQLSNLEASQGAVKSIEPVKFAEAKKPEADELMAEFSGSTESSTEPVKSAEAKKSEADELMAEFSGSTESSTEPVKSAEAKKSEADELMAEFSDSTESSTEPVKSAVAKKSAVKESTSAFSNSAENSSKYNSCASQTVLEDAVTIEKESTLCEVESDITDDKLPAEIKIPNDHTKLKKDRGHKLGYQVEWSEKFPWIRCEVREGKELLHCQLCKDQLINDPKYNNSIWRTKGISTVRLDKIKEHSISDMHNTSISIETSSLNNTDDKGTKQSEETPIFKAVEAAMKCLKFLIDNNISHTTIFRPFVEFCIKELKSPVLAPLKKSKDSTSSYTSYETITEFISSMAETQRHDVISTIKSSPFFSLMADETTDISSRKHLAVSARYMKDGNPVVSFIKDVQIPNGNADTVFSSITPLINDCGGYRKMSGFGSDGASVMVGENNGVSTKIKEQNSKVITIHCHNHRIALATKDSYEANSSLQKFDENIKALYKYYKNSSVRSSSLAAVQNVFSKERFTKLKRVSFTRWLSHHDAIDSVRKNFKNIIIDLENAVSLETVNHNLKGPTPQGLLKSIKTYQFFQWVHFMCDTLAVVKKLTLFFEKREVDISAIEGKVAIAQKDLEKLKRKPGGEFCKKIDEHAREHGIDVPIGGIINDPFKEQAVSFIDSLIENISDRMENLPIISSLGVLDLRQAQEEDCTTGYGTSEIVQLAQFFGYNEDDALVEWDDFKSIYMAPDSKQENYSIRNLCNILHKCESRIGQRFPFIQRLLNIALTLPVSTADVERVFSQVTLILSDHRNRLKVENTDNLLMIKLNGEPNYKTAVKHWHNKKKYRTFFM